MFGEHHIERLTQAIWGLTETIKARGLSCEDQQILDHLSFRAHALARRIAVVAKAAKKLDAATTE